MSQAAVGQEDLALVQWFVGIVVDEDYPGEKAMFAEMGGALVQRVAASPASSAAEGDSSETAFGFGGGDPNWVEIVSLIIATVQLLVDLRGKRTASDEEDSTVEQWEEALKQAGVKGRRAARLRGRHSDRLKELAAKVTRGR